VQAKAASLKAFGGIGVGGVLQLRIKFRRIRFLLSIISG
jgi:hypothetical protein